ncbi:polysaccharide pyruvyl transferase family protein [Cupriavidus yeoncheonensis]
MRINEAAIAPGRNSKIPVHVNRGIDGASQRSQTRVLTVGLAWHTFTSENLGVGALAESQLAIAQAAAARLGVQLRAISLCHSESRPESVLARGIVLADPMSPKRMLLRRSKFMSQLRECDVVLDIGEGDSFSDIYGAKRLVWLVLSKYLATRAGCKLVLSPQTIGPFSKWWARKLAAWAMGSAERVIARDALSMRYLQSQGLARNALELIDVAFRLPFTPPRPATDGIIRVGINVSGLLFNGGYTRNNQFGLKADYPALVQRLIDYFRGRPEVEVHLVSHVLADKNPVEDDYATALLLSQRPPGLIVAPKFSSPSQAKSYIAQLDFFTGARMHACIGAFSSGVPVVPMAYSRKFNGLFHSLKYSYLADLLADDTETAYQHVVYGFENRHTLRESVVQGNKIAEEKLQQYENYLVELFAKTDVEHY